MDSVILAMKPIINDSLAAIFGNNVCLASYNEQDKHFFRNIHDVVNNPSFKHELVPTSLLGDKQLHFNYGYPISTDEFSLIDKQLETYIKNLFRLVESALNKVMFMFKLNITFDKFNENGNHYFFNFNKPKAMSCRLTFEIQAKDYKYDHFLLAENIDRFVVMLNRSGKNMVVTNFSKVIEDMNTIKEGVLSISNVNISGLSLDLSQAEVDFQRELSVIDMVRI
jgi:hypothetical protein